MDKELEEVLLLSTFVQSWPGKMGASPCSGDKASSWVLYSGYLLPAAICCWEEALFKRELWNTVKCTGHQRRKRIWKSRMASLASLRERDLAWDPVMELEPWFFI